MKVCQLPEGCKLSSELLAGADFTTDDSVWELIQKGVAIGLSIEITPAKDGAVRWRIHRTWDGRLYESTILVEQTKQNWLKESLIAAIAFNDELILKKLGMSPPVMFDSATRRVMSLSDYESNGRQWPTVE